MMLTLNERRTVPVLTYSDLTKQFNEYNDAESLYWDRLQSAGRQLVKDLQDSLSLPSATWTDEDGNVQRYVEQGSTAEGEFKRVHPMVFQVADLTLSFAVRLTLEQGPNVFPKGFYIQNIRMCGNSAGFQVYLNADEEIIINAPRDIADGQFANVVETIKARLMKMLSTAPLA